MASLVDLIKHYQYTLENFGDDDDKILRCIDRLYGLAVTVQHLQDTGIGRTVNALRKETGPIGSAARALVNKWKLMVAAEENSDPEDNDYEKTNYKKDDGNSDDNLKESNSYKSTTVKTEPIEKEYKNFDVKNIKQEECEEGQYAKKRRPSESSYLPVKVKREKLSDNDSESSDSDNSNSEKDNVKTQIIKKCPETSQSRHSDKKIKLEQEKSNHRLSSSKSEKENSGKHKSHHKEKERSSSHHKSSKHSKLHDEKRHKSDSEKNKSSHKSDSSKDRSKSKDTCKEKSSKSSSEKHSSDKREHKSSHSKSSDKKSSSSHKSKKDTPKIHNEEGDGEIDCGSGASFAEALGMISSPVKSKKKTNKEVPSPVSSFNNDLSPASLLAPTAKLLPLPPLEISALPDISPHYRPRPPPKLLPHFTDEDSFSAGISSKNQRTKVYSGNKTIGKIPSLYDLCVNVLQEHIDALEYTGGVPYELIKPIVDKANPDQLFVLEHYNPYLMEDTDHLWQKYCQKHFRSKARQEMETWREMFMRCQEEQESKLKSLTENIKIAQEAKKAPIKQTKMAYVDSVVKPPRNIARKQAIHGTARQAAASPAARVASLVAPNVVRAGTVRPPPSQPVSMSSFNKPKKAPLMAKALQFMRGGRKR